MSFGSLPVLNALKNDFVLKRLRDGLCSNVRRNVKHDRSLDNHRYLHARFTGFAACFYYGQT